MMEMNLVNEITFLKDQLYSMFNEDWKQREEL